MKQLTLNELYQMLYEHLGTVLWPGDSKLEISLDAILVQNTSWENVVPAIEQLKAQTKINPQKILKLSDTELQTLIRPSGFYRSKSRTIQAFLEWLATADFELSAIAQRDTADLREQLLAIKGIGQETADVILLFALDKPKFIADSYARRLFRALGVKSVMTYAGLQKAIEQSDLDLSLAQWQNFHNLIDDFGKRYLRKNQTAVDNFLLNTQLLL